MESKIEEILKLIEALNNAKVDEPVSYLTNQFTEEIKQKILEYLNDKQRYYQHQLNRNKTYNQEHGIKF